MRELGSNSKLFHGLAAVSLRKLFNHTELRFPHLQNEVNDIVYSVWWCFIVTILSIPVECFWEEISETFSPCVSDCLAPLYKRAHLHLLPSAWLKSSKLVPHINDVQCQSIIFTEFRVKFYPIPVYLFYARGVEPLLETSVPLLQCDASLGEVGGSDGDGQTSPTVPMLVTAQMRCLDKPGKDSRFHSSPGYPHWHSAWFMESLNSTKGTSRECVYFFPTTAFSYGFFFPALWKIRKISLLSVVLVIRICFVLVIMIYI